MSHKIKDNVVAVSTDAYWIPIDENAPRGVKVLAIARDAAGLAQPAHLLANEQWYTHWYPVPKFRDDEDVHK